MSKMLKTLAVVTAVTVGGAVLAHESFADDKYERGYGRGNGDCMMVMGKGGRHGGGRMAMLGQYDPDRVLTVAQVKTLAEAHLIRMGNPNLKVGKITKTDNGNYTVETVTKDGSLVDTVVVDKTTGMPEYMMERMRARFQDRDDDDRRGPGMGRHHGGKGHMGMGGRGMGGGRYARDLDLNAEQVRILVEAQLIKAGNDNLTIGEVKKVDDDDYAVQIVTKDGSLVNTIEVDEDTGRPECPRAEMFDKR